MTNSDKYKGIFHVEQYEVIQDEELDEGWYWWDEVGLLGSNIACLTEREAYEEQGNYAKWLAQELEYISNKDKEL